MNEALKITGERRAGEPIDDQPEAYGPPLQILPEISVGGQVFALTHSMNLDRARRIVEGARTEIQGQDRISRKSGT